MKAEQFVASPCSCPQIQLEKFLTDISAAGYRKIELFTEWATSKVDISHAIDDYLSLGSKYGIEFSSMHLPGIDDNLETGVEQAIKAATFAEKLGVEVVIYKATSKDLYIAGAQAFLDGIDDLTVTPVLQNHNGTPITTIDDYRTVIAGINDDRMKTLLEVGQFHSIGISWQEGYDFLGDRIALVHVKDQIADTKVPFGRGEVDFKGLFSQLKADAYTGNVVIELEVCRDDYPRTLNLLAEARLFCETIIES